ncbi:MAG: outer membrane protein assembly factor BamA [Candidatus Edwardsbacteria bacterium]
MKTILAIVFLFFSTNLFAITISEITVEGNRNVEQSTILNTLRLEVGDELDREELAEAVKRLYQLESFSDIEVQSEETTSGIKLVFRIKEKPTLERIEFVGNKKIKTKEIEKKLTIHPGSLIDAPAIQENREKILEFYKEQGYLNATVRDSLWGDENKVALKFFINEGKKIRIKKIKIEGNQSIPPQKILKVMKTKKRGWRFVWKVIPWYSKGSFDTDTLREDLERISYLYKKNGYLDIKILGDSLSYNEKRDRLFITIKLEEGLQYHIGTIVFEGDSVMKEQGLKGQLKFKEGEVANQEKFDKSLENLYNLYTEFGYIYCSIIPEQEKREQIVNLCYEIHEGKPAHINKISITGNTKTREKVIRRELVVYPGELFQRSQIIRSQRELFALGYFEDIKLETEPADTFGNIDLVFQVKEKQAGQFQIGATYSEQEKIGGYLSIGEPNFRGRGQTVNLKWEFGFGERRRNNIELSFTEPWFLDTPTIAGFDIYQTRREYDYYTESKTGGGVRIGRPVPWLDYTKLYWAYHLERIRLEGENVVDTRPKISSSTSLNLVRDSRNKPFYTTSGSRRSLYLEFCGGPLGGSVEYQRLIAESCLYYPSFWKFSWLLRGRIGVVDRYRKDPLTIPVNQLFYVGGTGEDGIRGYPDRSINRAGGRAMFIATIEHRFPLGDIAYLSLFGETGNSWKSVTEAFKVGGMKNGAGIGVRVEVPMLGIIGADYAYRFNDFDYGKRHRWEFHFQFGSAF